MTLLKFLKEQNRELRKAGLISKKEKKSVQVLEEGATPYYRAGDVRVALDLAKTMHQAFYTEFVRLYPLFNDQLLALSNDLTLGDLTLCAYIKLGFTTKEIAAYSSSTAGAVDSRKSRIREKLKIPQKPGALEIVIASLH